MVKRNPQEEGIKNKQRTGSGESKYKIKINKSRRWGWKKARQKPNKALKGFMRKLGRVYIRRSLLLSYKSSLQVALPPWKAGKIHRNFPHFITESRASFPVPWQIKFRPHFYVSRIIVKHDLQSLSGCWGLVWRLLNSFMRIPFWPICFLQFRTEMFA